MGFNQVKRKEEKNKMTITPSFCYPVGEEELSLGSQEVGQIAVFAVFHNHHQRTCLMEVQH